MVTCAADGQVGLGFGGGAAAWGDADLCSGRPGGIGEGRVAAGGDSGSCSRRPGMCGGEGGEIDWHVCWGGGGGGCTAKTREN